MAMQRLAEVFPALEVLKDSKGDRVSLVNQTIVEEVLQDLGTLDFGKDVTPPMPTSPCGTRAVSTATAAAFGAAVASRNFAEAAEASVAAGGAGAKQPAWDAARTSARA